MSAKATTGGKDVPTGDQWWTLFLNAANFKGPVTFFAPNFWSKPTIERPHLKGMFLDVRPSEPNKAIQMETQHISAYLGTDAKGDTYARVAPTRFPARGRGRAAHPPSHGVRPGSRATWRWCTSSPRSARSC